MIKKLFLFLFILLSLTSSSFATTGIILYAPKMIYIAVDSKAGKESACKVIKKGSLVAIYSGLARYQKVQIRDIITDAMDENISIYQNASVLGDRLSNFFDQHLKEIKLTHPAIYGSYTTDDHIAEFALASYQEGHFEIIVKSIKFCAASNKVISITNYKCPEDCQGMQVFTIGVKKSISEYLKLNPYADNDRGKFIHILMDLAIKEEPDKVGPPINIIRIDHNGTQWIEKNNCD